MIPVQKPGLLSFRVCRDAMGLLAAIVLASPPAGFAADGSWNSDSAGNWSDTSKWTPVAIPGGAGSIVNLTFNITAARSVTVDTTSRTAGTLTIGDSNASHAYTLNSSGGASLIFDNGVPPAQLNMAATSLGDTVSAPILLNGSLNIANAAAANTLTVSGAIAANSAGAKTIANVGAGAGGVILSGVIADGGGGTLALTQNSATSVLRLSAAGTYSGDTTVSAGILRLGAANAIPNGAGKGNVSVTGTLDLNTFSDVINGLSGSGTVNNLAAGTPTLTVGDNNQSGAFSGIIQNTAGTLALTKIGSGTLTLSGANAYSGSTTISNGTVELDYTTLGGKLPDASILILAGGAVNLANNAGTHNEVVASTTLNPGAAAVTRTSGASVLRLNAVTRNTGGTIDFGAAGVADTDRNNSGGILGGWATLGGADWAVNSTDLADGPVAAYSGYASDAWAAGNHVTVTGDGAPASDSTASSLRFDAAAAATVTLSGVNTLTAGGILVTPNVGNNLTTITGGTLQGAASADLVVHQYNTANELAIASILQNNTAATALTKSGAGRLTVSGPNTYTGATYVNAGTLRVQNATGLGTIAGGVFVYRPATVELDGGITVGNESMTLYGTLSNPAGTNTYGGSISLQTGAAIDVGADSLLIVAGSTVDVGAQPFTKTGDGLLRFTADPNHRGVMTVQSGTVELQHSGSTDANIIINPGATLREITSGDLGDYNVQADGTLDLRAGDQIGGLDGSGGGTVTVGSATAVTLTLGGGNRGGSFGGSLQNGAGTLSLSKVGTGTQVLAGASSYSGATTITDGPVWLTGAGSIAGSPSVIVRGVLSNPGRSTLLQLGSPAATPDGAVADRIGDAVTVNLQNGASLTMNGSSAAGTTLEQFGALILNRVVVSPDAGGGNITLTLTPAAGQDVELNAASLSRPNPGVTALIRGTNLGAAPGADTSRLTLDSAAGIGLVGGGGGAGSLNVSLLPYMVGDINAAGVGTDLVTYDDTLGMRTLAAGEYDTRAGAVGSTDHNVAVAAADTLTGDQTVNGLKLSGGTYTLGLGGFKLGVASGALVFNPASAANVTVDNGTLDFGAREGIFHLTGAGVMTATVNAAISGSGGITLNSTRSGNVLVLGGNNTFNGFVNINGGILALGSAAALNNNTVYVNNLGPNSGVLRLNGYSASLANLNGHGAVENGVNGTVVLTLNVYSNLTFNGVLQNGGAASDVLALTKNGPGNLTMQNVHTYTGATVINDGTLTLTGTAPGGINASGSVTVNPGATLTVGSTGDDVSNPNRLPNAGAITLNGATLNLNGSSNTGNGGITDETTGPLTIAGGLSTITLTPNSSRQVQLKPTGAIARGAGSVVFVRGASLGGASGTANTSRFLPGTAPSVIGGGGITGSSTISIVPWMVGDNRGAGGMGNSFITITNPIVGGLRPLAEAEFTATFAANNNVSITANTTQGAVAINALRILGGNLTLTGVLTLDSGAMLITNAPTISGTGIQLGSAGTQEGVFSIFGTADRTATISSPITGSGGLTLSANRPASVFALTGANNATLSGDVTVNGGVLRAASGTGLPTGSLLVLNSGVWETTANITRALGAAAGNVNLVNGASGFSANAAARTVNLGGALAPIVWDSTPGFTPGTLVLNAATANNALNFQNPLDLNGVIRKVSVGANTATMSGIVSGTGGSALMKLGSGTLVLNQANTYAGGTILAAGTLSVGAAANLPTAGGLVFTGGVLQVTGTTIADLNAYQINPGTFSGGFDIATSTHTFTFTNAISGTGSLTKNGVGTLVLTGTNAHTGGTTLNAGTVRPENDSAFGTGTVTLNNAPTVSVAVATCTLTNAIAGGGSLNKSGPGYLVLTRTNTYTGGTAVLQGALIANGTLTVGRGTVWLGHTLGANPAALLIGPGDGRTIENTITNRNGATGLQLLGGVNASGTNTFEGDIVLGSTLNTGRSVVLGGSAGGQVDFAGRIQRNGTDLTAGVMTTNLTGSGVARIRLDNLNTYAGGTIVGPDTRLIVAGGTNGIHSALGLNTPANVLSLQGGTAEFGDVKEMIAGLRESLLDGSGFNALMAGDPFATTLGIPMGQNYVASTAERTVFSDTTWGSTETWIYKGQFYNNSGHFSFAKSIDDNVWIKLDEVVILNDGTWNSVVSTGDNGGAGWGMGPKGDGWHDIEIRLYNGSGGAGAVAQNNWTTTFGFGVNTNGGAHPYTSTSALDYEMPADLGTMNLFRTLGSAAVTTLTLSNNVAVGANSVLDMGANLTSLTLGDLAIGACTLSVTNPGAAAAFALDDGTLSGNATLDIAAGIEMTMDAIGDGSLGFGLTKAGAGTLDLSGASTYTGPTVVLAGTLAVNGSLAAGSALSVSPGGTLGGTGTVSGAVVVGPGGKFAAGNSIGTNTVGSLTLTPGSTFEVEADGGAVDQTISLGPVDLGGATLSTVALGAPTFTSALILSNATGEITGQFAGLFEADQVLVGGVPYFIHYRPTYVELNLTPTAVVLHQFGAIAEGAKVVVRWRTASEVRTVGFDVYRKVDGKWVKVNDALIAATGAPLGGLGAAYAVTDAGAAAGGTYEYKLVEVEQDGTQNEYGPYERTATAFEMTSPIRATAQGMEIRWLSRTGERYRVLRAIDLRAATPEAIGRGIEATPPENVFLDTNAAPLRVYRVELEE